MKKKILYMIVSCMLCCLVVPALANPIEQPMEKANHFSVTVPTEFPLYVDEYGRTTVAGTCEITNNSDAPVIVTETFVNAKNHWEIYSTGTDFGKEPVGTRGFSMTIQASPVQTNGSCAASFPEIQVNESIPVFVDAKVAAQKDSINNQVIAQIVFVVGWAQNPMDMIVEEPIPEEIPVAPLDPPVMEPEQPSVMPEQPPFEDVVPPSIPPIDDLFPPVVSPPEEVLPPVVEPEKPEEPVIPEQPEESIPEFIPPLPPAQF